MTAAFFLTPHSPRHPLLVALAERGERIIHVDDFSRLQPADLQGCRAYFGNLFAEIKRFPAFQRLKRMLRTRGVPYVFWNRDAPWNVGIKPWRAALVRWTRPVDVYLAHSLQTADWFASSGHYFPNAASRAYCDGTDLIALRDESSYQWDLSFFGALGNRERRSCRERMEFLDALGSRLRRELRIRWVDTVTDRLDLAAQLQLIRTSKINLNFGAMCDLPGERSWGLPERAFGIPAAGGFLLTDDRACIPQTFGDACDSFSDIDDCARRVAALLNDFSHLRDRADALHRQVLERHTYAVRAETLLKLVDQWHTVGQGKR